MFQRLYEAFDTNPHIPFTSRQNVFFNILPNINLSSSGPFEFKSAIESVEPGINQYQRTIKYPNDIFMSDSNKGLEELAKTCSSSSIDELIAMKNPNAIRCGWMYTPPTIGSPYPKISQGVVGDTNGPIKSYVPDSSYKKWFFDLQEAKRTMLIDKCKALKSCNDIDTNTYKGVCGYCPDNSQGVPIDSNGNLLYAGDPMGTCSSTHIKNVSNCPVVEETSGPQPSIDRTCEPVDGHLSRQCLYNTVVNNGCSSNGSLAQALAQALQPGSSNYTENIDAMKAYKKFYSNPLSGFENGNETIDAVLREVQQLALDTKKSGQIQFPAKDLCIRKGLMEGYDFCADLNDSTPPPFMLDCIQKIFLKLGGQPAGSSYPKLENIEDYNNTFANIGEVKQYFDMIIQNTKSSNYNVQRDAMIQLLGITIEDTKKRAPYKQGVEVFWFVQTLGVPNGVNGFLRRTIEKDIIMFDGNLPSKTRVGFSEYANMIQLTDFRTQSNITTTFNVKIDDGFFISLNKPPQNDAELLYRRFVSNATDNIVPDAFAYIYAQAPTWHQSKSTFEFKAYFPNIVKLFYEDCYGGGQTFVIEEKPLNGTNNVEKLLNSYNYSLTCEEFAPFLNFEVNDTALTNGVVESIQSSEYFQETRNPGMFAQFVKSSNLDYHRGSSEKQYVPGKKSFARFKSNSRVDMLNIAYQSWKYVTFAIRLQSIPMNEEVIINFTTSDYNYKVILKKYNELTATINISHTFNTKQNVETTYLLSLNSWYLLIIKNLGNGLGISCNNIKDMQTTKKTLIFKEIIAGKQIYVTNGTQNPTKDTPRSNTSIVIGAVNNSSQKQCIFDIAWVHFFDYNVQDTNVYRDCMADWVFTEIT